MNTTDSPVLLDCGHPESPHEDFTRGYGTDAKGQKHCYECCASNDRAEMIRTGTITFYLGGGSDGKPYTVSNWPGSLSFPAYGVRSTRIGFCLDGRIAYFTGPDGARWSARGPGLGMYARCRRLKSV